MTNTEHYQLNQWDTADPIRREDFNADNAVIDGVLSTLAENLTDLTGKANAERVCVGSYIGDGTSMRTIQLPFAPKFAMILGRVNSSDATIIMTPDVNFFIYGSLREANSQYNTKLVGDTFCIQNENFNNQSDTTFYYFLFR